MVLLLNRNSLRAGAMRFRIRQLFCSSLQRLGCPGGVLSTQGLRFLSGPLSRGAFLSAGSCQGRPRDLVIREIVIPGQSQVTSLPEYENLFRYTSGRWLWDEERQLRDRYRVFNVTELQNVAAKSVGSGGCVSMIKLAEGGYNKVFRLVMDDGKTVIARIPNPNAGPSFYTTASEVATMELVSRSCRYTICCSVRETDATARPGPYFISPFLKCMDGALLPTTSLAQNTLLWGRLQGCSLEARGMK